MRIHPFLLVAILLTSLYASGCSRCSSEGIEESSPVDGTGALEWEKVPMGLSPEELKEALWAMGGFEGDARPEIVCSPQVALSVIDDEKDTMEERGAPGRKLSNCALMQAGTFGRSWRLASAKGELLDGALVALTFRFSEAEYAGLVGGLKERLGPGTQRRIEDVSVLGEEPVEAILWKKDGELWAVFKGVSGATLLRQDSDELRALPPAVQAAQPGKKVSLDDIGLGGGLDLSGDDLDDIPVIEEEKEKPADAGAPDAGN